MIIGSSGAGKSDLAFGMIGLGAKLVSDDLTLLHLKGEEIIASCPNPAFAGAIEARGLGLLHAPYAPMAKLQLILNLSQVEPERLPPRRNHSLLGRNVDLVLRPQSDHLAVVMMLMMKDGLFKPNP